MAKPHKYHAKRTEGYASKAEARRAEELRILLDAGIIDALAEQVPIGLGPDSKTIVDFVITENFKTFAEEVKGFETTDFKRVKRLWRKYGPFPMKILKLVKGRWQTEWITGVTDGM